MSRLPLLPFLALVALGCGGSSSGSSTEIGSRLGASALDLTVSGASADATAMKGTGDAIGSLEFVAPESDGVASAITLEAHRYASKTGKGKTLDQSLTLRLGGPTTFNTYDSYTIDGTTNTATYSEALSDGADSTGFRWEATAGKVEVVSHVGSKAVVRLSNVTLLVSDATGDPKTITISGTITGTVDNPFIPTVPVTQ